MARDHARIYCSIWGNQDFVALPAEAQRLYLLVASQRDLSNAGTIAYTPAKWARLSPNTTTAMIRKTARLLEKTRFFVIDEASEELFIRTFIRHDRVLAQPNVAVNMANSAQLIVSPKIRGAFLDVLAQLRDDDDPHQPMPGWAKPQVAALLMEARSAQLV